MSRPYRPGATRPLARAGAAGPAAPHTARCWHRPVVRSSGGDTRTTVRVLGSLAIRGAFWGADVVSPAGGANQRYSVVVEIVQGSMVVPGGRDTKAGPFDGVITVDDTIGITVT